MSDTFIIVLSICMWGFVLDYRLEKIEKRLLSQEKFTKIIESARNIALEAEKNSMTETARKRFHTLYLMFQTLYDACRNPNLM